VVTVLAVDDLVVLPADRSSDTSRRYRRQYVIRLV